MTKFFSLIGLVCAAIVALVFWAASSDIQITVAGVFAVAAINAFGFAAVVHRLDPEGPNTSLGIVIGSPNIRIGFKF